MADGPFSLFDEYDLKARLAPALLVLLPPTLLIIIWWPALWTLGEALVSAGLAFVLLACLILLVSALGRRVEVRWGEAIGTPHSARLLSHANPEIHEDEKNRIHAFFAQHGHAIPSPAEEEQVGQDAQRRRIGAVKWLITISRPEAAKTLLLKENIAYGFWRNLQALKWFALALTAAVIATDAYLLSQADRSDPRLVAGIGLLVLCGAIVVFLVLAVRRKQLIVASRGYALRLFSLRDDEEVRRRAAASIASLSRPPAAASTAAPSASIGGTTP